jgi:hypothetical protein
MSPFVGLLLKQLPSLIPVVESLVKNNATTAWSPWNRRSIG